MRTPSAADVVTALESFVEAADAADRDLAQSLGIGRNDLRVMRRLVDADPERPATAGDLSSMLGVSSASVTALVDRLEKMGWVAREHNPGDRRSVLVRSTLGSSSDEVAALTARERVWLRTASEIDGSDADVLVAFLTAAARL